MLLCEQPQEDFLYDLIKSPTKSGAQNYKELCIFIAARQEKRLERRSNSALRMRSNKEHSSQTQKNHFQVFRCIRVI